MPESVDRELDKCDYLHQAREALHHLSTEMNEEMQLKRRFEDSTPAYRQKQFCEGVKRITELKGSFSNLTNEQQEKILVTMLGVPQINAAPVPTVAPVVPAPADAPVSADAPVPTASPATPAVPVAPADAPTPAASPAPAPVDAPASSISPATPSASAIANDDTGGESARDTIRTTMTDALADDDMWV